MTHTIYKIPCNNCDKIYVGQTKQYLKERIKQHKNYNNNQQTALRKHEIEKQHHFNYDNTKIITTEKHTQKRLLLEMIHIQKNINKTVNNRNDIQGLSSIYHNII